MIGITSFFLNILFIIRLLLLFISIINFTIWFLSLYFRLEKKVYIKPSGKPNPQTVSILVPLHKEKEKSIMTTAKSIVAQTYPKEKFEVVFIIEADDALTKKNLKTFRKYFKDKGVRYRIVESDGKAKVKAHALNCALTTVDSQIICVYDADDTFPKTQVEEAVLLIEEGYDAVAVRVYRSGNTILGSLLNLDTYLWWNIFIPFYKVVGKSFPFSGEGMCVRKDVLHAVGGFPEVLTEDSYLSLLLAEGGFKTVLLDSEVEELAPKNLKNNIKQRLRWNRGYMQCLNKLFKAKIPIKEKLPLFISYLAPVTCGMSLLAAIAYMFIDGWAFALADLVVPWIRVFFTTWNLKILLSVSVSYLLTGAFMYFISILLSGKRFKRLTPYVPLLPIYWIYLGFVAFLTPFVSSKKWFKTERR
jgi:cellulose synthase/poly-beta-1,6-N-acetylglucosamine synthase-like glycosyltransferase